ncbi:DUF4238 domain-containing protein [Escherichia coli]|uniref:DUF4238 domain-containing protein n=1 Tax=Escherichia coli TaxID=562 RepID=UPI000BE9C5F6|nr:DUF4238 domain-containing protein [Escherichia coli]ELK0554614.1 DUF4238 domain-containing protein [Escherichia coli]ELQ6664588.1 DUF4238 domain-containing protein [Escherichia coli]MBA1030754.1 DUF4238 domain-containing protein [Escherichia coli]MBE8930398.1 DUF4238 domain-containing protein [Escherichia coli]MBE8978755.1 DUF4238 domain-containing protein [Escherichia coli]
MSVARHHHFLSQCYLKGFTSNGGKKSKLTVIDLKERKTFESNTRNVGGVRDFNRLELDGVDPNYLESSLAEFEGSVATHLRKLEEGGEFSGETKDVILEFISLLAIRTPAQREHLSSPLKQIAKFIMKSSVSSAERWDDCKLAYEKEMGESLPYDLAYEKIKNFVDGDNFEINVIREFMIYMEMKCVPVITKLLHQRNWSLMTISDGQGSFITSDNPVCLMWTNPELARGPYSPGFGVKDTLVLFPVSKNLLLAGEFDGHEGVFSCNEEQAAVFNTSVIRHTAERIFSSNDNFKFLDSSKKMKQGKSLV